MNSIQTEKFMQFVKQQIAHIVSFSNCYQTAYLGKLCSGLRTWRSKLQYLLAPFAFRSISRLPPLTSSTVYCLLSEFHKPPRLNFLEQIQPPSNRLVSCWALRN